MSGEAGNQGHRPDGLEARAEVEAPDADRIGNDDDGQQEQEVDRAEPVIAPGVDAARIMVLQPVGADHDVAENQREIFAPLLGHGLRQVAVAMRALGRSRDLDLDDQQGQRDRENRVAEPLEAVEPALGAMGLRVGALSHHAETRTARARFLTTKRLRKRLQWARNGHSRSAGAASAPGKDRPLAISAVTGLWVHGPGRDLRVACGEPRNDGGKRGAKDPRHALARAGAPSPHPPAGARLARHRPGSHPVRNGREGAGLGRGQRRRHRARHPAAADAAGDPDRWHARRDRRGAAGPPAQPARRFERLRRPAGGSARRRAGALFRPCRGAVLCAAARRDPRRARLDRARRRGRRARRLYRRPRPRRAGDRQPRRRRDLARDQPAPTRSPSPRSCSGSWARSRTARWCMSSSRRPSSPSRRRCC